VTNLPELEKISYILTTLLQFITQDSVLIEMPHLCKASSGIYGWFCNKASSVVLCAREFKSLRITQETEFGGGGGGVTRG
jgi:hypothetical protein